MEIYFKTIISGVNSLTEEEKLKKQLEKLMNTDAKLHGEMMKIILELRKTYSDIEIMAIGILISKASRHHMGANK